MLPMGHVHLFKGLSSADIVDKVLEWKYRGDTFDE